MQLPVVVEEAKMLHQEVVARRWAMKARKLMATAPRLDSVEVCVTFNICFVSFLLLDFMSSEVIRKCIQVYSF